MMLFMIHITVVECTRQIINRGVILKTCGFPKMHYHYILPVSFKSISDTGYTWWLYLGLAFSSSIWVCRYMFRRLPIYCVQFSLKTEQKFACVRVVNLGDFRLFWLFSLIRVAPGDTFILYSGALRHIL